MKYGIGFLAVLCIAGAAYAQDTPDPFADGADGAKVHTASGFVCPQQVGHFERDAVGERDPEAGADFCAYSALDGVYGTVTLEPLHGPYDPKAILAPDFVVQEGTGGRMIDESTRSIGPKATPLAIYTRTYETAKLESLHYRTLFASALLGAWTVQVTIEYADPRDDDAETEFFKAAYLDAMTNIAGSGQPAPH
jgi:hypothetical protein